MATIYIDGRQYEVEGAGNLLQTCLSLGLDIPYFCWHPAMGSVGSCRQCAVKVHKAKDDKRGTLVMACMTSVQDNAFISIEDEEAVAFRRNVVEWLMANHPHDCPTCSEGGQCQLQDMVVQAGHSRRRYRFDKRTYTNQDLGPFVAQEMNRCITCYRCVRYYRDVAGGTDFGAYGAHDNVCFGRETDGTLESEFAGNLTEICPTGVFTDKAYNGRFSRKWDLQYAPGICQGCAVGCNIRVGERAGVIRRVENRHNAAVNQYFLCDRGRFGQDYVNRADRPHAAPVDLAPVRDALRGRRVFGIGSPRASLEGNHALRSLVGAENMSAGVEAGEWERLHFMREMVEHGPLPSASLQEMEDCDAVIVLGEDLTQTAARMALAVRQAANGRAVDVAAEQGIPAWHARAVADVAQGAQYPVFLASLCETKLDDVAAGCFHGVAEDIARLGAALAHALDQTAPAVDSPDDAWVQQAAAALRGARKPLIIAGEALASHAVLEAAAAIAAALGKGGRTGGYLSLVPQEVNSLGVAMMGGIDLQKALRRCADGVVDTLVVLENDLFQRAEPALVEAALAKVETLIVVDHQQTETLERADFALPAASFAEAGGVVVNYEGRAQRYYAAYAPRFLKPDDEIQPGWRWMEELGSSDASSCDTQEDVLGACAKAYRGMAGLEGLAVSAHGRLPGQAVARQSLRGSGRTALRAHIDIREPRQPQDGDSALAFSMEGDRGADTVIQQGDPGVLLGRADASRREDGVRVHIPARQDGAAGEWRIAPLYHLFGSDPVSARSAVLQERMPAPYLLLNMQEEAALPAGRMCRLEVGGETFHLPVRLSAALPPGVVGLPMGIGGVSRRLIGQPARVTAEERA